LPVGDQKKLPLHGQTSGGHVDEFPAKGNVFYPSLMKRWIADNCIVKPGRPVSPHLAAEIDGVEINPERMVIPRLSGLM
jgi:hypothetical protein